MKIIEPHVHVWTLDSITYPWSDSTINPPTESATAEELLDVLDANGVSGAVLVQVIHYGTDNAYVADVLRRYPARFAGVCLVDPLLPDAPQRLEYEVRERGFTGLRLRPCADRSSTWLSDPATIPLWEKAAELGITINLLTHIEQLAMVPAVARQFPSVPIIVDHLGWPPPEEGPNGPALQHLLRLAECPSVHVKITDPWAVSPGEEYPYRGVEPIYRRVFEDFGPQRCLWGSDWPLVRHECGYDKALALYSGAWDWIGESDREWILYRNIQKLYPKPFANH